MSLHLIVVGLNYRTAPVEVREKFALSEQDLPQALKALKRTMGILEGVIVATCNRTEIYAVVDRHTLCGHFIRSFMEQWFNVPRMEFNPYLFMYEDDQAIDHLFKVACGLDSMVIGETQILGQVKDAFLLAQQQGATGTLFNKLFKQAITVAKRAHSETSIGESAVSVSYAAVELGKRIFGRFDNKKVMILGAGKMSELTARHLSSNGAKEVWVVNRTFSRAVELADKFDGLAVPLDDAMERLQEADIIISSTGANRYMLDKDSVEKAMLKRKGKPMFLIDIAVPRDIDPAIAGLPNVYLYDIDDLEGIVETNIMKRKQEAALIESMIGEEREAYHQWYATLGVAPLIRGLQEKTASVHERTMESLLRKLPELDEHQIKVIGKLTKSMLNQVIHDPILKVKEMSAEKRGEAVMETFTELFGLEEDGERLKAEMNAQEKARTAGNPASKEAKPGEKPTSGAASLLSQLAGALR